ncbi:hypothetical protein EJD97_025233 [Solanum chilense]|uniref:Integrase core domain containing protein n=1 Tax=Solanum chilense TaxID=4083 RepID=A0A6N2C412_SOLCI|nr:hypothetical protein EJD97_025233 [Solanum chilense]
MAPKQDRFYARGRSKSGAPSARLVIGSDHERDPKYVPLGTSTPSRAARATPKKVASGVVTASQSDEERTLTDTPSGSESTPGSPACAFTPVTDQPNQWCVDGQFQVYSDAKFLNDKGVMTRTLTLERRVLRGSLPTMPEIHNLFTRHQLEWTARPLGHYTHIDRRDAPTKQAPLEQIVKDGQFLREPSPRETTKMWMALYLSIDGEGIDWCLSSTAADNIVTLDREVLMAAMIAGFEVDFVWLLQAVMHERAFKARTATHTASTDTTPVECIPGSSTVSSSSRSAPLPALVPLARRSITEAEEHLERRMFQHTERKIAEVHQRLDAFELRVLARPAPLVDVSTLQAAVDSLRADIYMILDTRVPEFEGPSVQAAEDTVMAALFATSEIPPPPPREHAKRRRGQEEDKARARKKERREMEAARRASLAEEEARQIIAEELAAGAPSSRTVEIAGVNCLYINILGRVQWHIK